jgi:hypothetical protein
MGRFCPPVESSENVSKVVIVAEQVEAFADPFKRSGYIAQDDLFHSCLDRLLALRLGLIGQKDPLSVSTKSGKKTIIRIGKRTVSFELRISQDKDSKGRPRSNRRSMVCGYPGRRDRRRGSRRWEPASVE